MNFENLSKQILSNLKEYYPKITIGTTIIDSHLFLNILLKNPDVNGYYLCLDNNFDKYLLETLFNLKDNVLEQIKIEDSKSKSIILENIVNKINLILNT